jgi:hypothetical protein
MKRGSAKSARAGLRGSMAGTRRCTPRRNRIFVYRGEQNGRKPSRAISEAPSMRAANLWPWRTVGNAAEVDVSDCMLEEIVDTCNNNGIDPLQHVSTTSPPTGLDQDPWM